MSVVDARLAIDLVEGFRGHAGRYALAAFAVSVGIMAFALLVLIVSGLDARVREITESFGADVVSIVREDPLSGPVEGLSMKHVEAIRANFPALSVTPLRYFESRVPGGADPVTVVATGPGLVGIRGWSIQSGRNIDAADVRTGMRVVVASRQLDEAAHWRAGRVVIIDDVPFYIAGIVDAQAPRLPVEHVGGLAAMGERFALVPWSTMSSWRGLRGDNGRRLDQVLVRGGDPVSVVAALQHLLKQADLDAGNVSWVTARRLVAEIEQLKRTVALGVGAVAVLCLLLGGTTLMSLMVLNVRERLGEIGLRVSLGARRAQISALFVVEALLVTTFSGIVGTIAAHVLAAMAGETLPMDLEPGWTSLLAPTALAVALGTAFSWWPARIAARITPAEAIRSD